MWRIVKQSDRESMIDELQRLKPLTDSEDGPQRDRAIAFAIAELQASTQDQASINLSGSRTNGDNYLSLIIGPRSRTPEWSINKTNLPKNLTREQLIAFLSQATIDEEQTRAVNFAVNELQNSTQAGGSVNISGDPASGFLSISVSAAD